MEFDESYSTTAVQKKRHQEQIYSIAYLKLITHHTTDLLAN